MHIIHTSYIHMHIIHTYVHAYIHMYIHTYICTCIHTYVHAYIHMYIHTYIHMYIHTYIMYIHTYICTYMHTHVHTYIHIHTYIDTAIKRWDKNEYRIYTMCLPSSLRLKKMLSNFFLLNNISSVTKVSMPMRNSSIFVAYDFAGHDAMWAVVRKQVGFLYLL